MTDSDKLFIYQAIQQADKWHQRYRNALMVATGRNQKRIDDCYRNWKDSEDNLDNLIYAIAKKRIYE